MDVILDILGSAFLDNAKYFAENLLIICQFFLINRYFAYYFLSAIVTVLNIWLFATAF